MIQSTTRLTSLTLREEGADCKIDNAEDSNAERCNNDKDNSSADNGGATARGDRRVVDENDDDIADVDEDDVMMASDVERTHERTNERRRTQRGRNRVCSIDDEDERRLYE